jgi:hypothetical protein
MKVCIKCNRSYSDDSLAFCLECGSPLQAGSVSGQTAATAIMTPTQFAHQTPTAQMQPNLTTPQYAPPIQAQPQTPSYQPTPSEKPSNAGRFTALSCIFLTFVGIFLFAAGMIGIALEIKDDTVQMVLGFTLLIALFTPAFGTLFGLFSLYLAFRSRDGKGAKKTAVAAVIFNLLFVLGFVALMTLGAIHNVLYG